MNEKEVLGLGYEWAIETINKCSTKHGLYASGGLNGYKGIWSRDSNITLIGASTEKSEKIKLQWKKSLEVLKKYQGKLGEIPNAVLNLDKKKRKVDFKSIDSSLWFIIGHYFYKKRYHDASLFKKHEKAIKKTLKWIYYRDFGEDTTLEQLPTTDWQDAFPDKYGVTINTQALYYAVLDLVGEKKKKKKLRKIINKNKEDGLWSKDFYWAYRWKNHNKYKEIGDWFDSFGNLLAVVFGLAGKKRSKNILKHIAEKKINLPFPVKCIFPYIKPGSKYWQDYYYDARATPGHYLNGGIWPFIGGFYVLALIKLKKFKQAEQELLSLAKCNLKGNIFPEWIDPKTQQTHGELQAWSAGVYIWAYNSLNAKRVL